MRGWLTLSAIEHLVNYPSQSLEDVEPEKTKYNMIGCLAALGGFIEKVLPLFGDLLIEGFILVLAQVMFINALTTLLKDL